MSQDLSEQQIYAEMQHEFSTNLAPSLQKLTQITFSQAELTGLLQTTNSYIVKIICIILGGLAGENRILQPNECMPILTSLDEFTSNLSGFTKENVDFLANHLRQERAFEQDVVAQLQAQFPTVLKLLQLVSTIMEYKSKSTRYEQLQAILASRMGPADADGDDEEFDGEFIDEDDMQ